MCVASIPLCATLCVDVHLFHNNPATAPCPNAGGGRDGEHAPAAVVDAGGGNKRPLLEGTLSTAGLHHRRQKKMHYVHSPPVLLLAYRYITVR